ncbi:hypothetical protein QBC47DRAFT_440861 [Echria macrotheca]|uniref:DOMON domain-containing protein n=1 Tax=Echria macrotheca TaxID=438768 RepID=A0AAJ0BK27_9PEZI|nr:hypothetical protein QBC47DRAFT_440861 [Echria macrotheca]
MLWSLYFGLLALVLRHVAASTLYLDPQTGLTFASDEKIYMNDKQGIIYRFAIPDGIDSTATPYDTVIQIVAPREVTWAGLAFGGTMDKCPLFVAYRSNGGQQAVTGSIRWAPGHQAPVPYTGANYTVYKEGTKSNNTHWQITARCTGCTSWIPEKNAATKYMRFTGSNRVAMAMGLKPVANPNSNTSDIDYHYMHAYWDADFKMATNANFTTTVQKLKGFEATS